VAADEDSPLFNSTKMHTEEEKIEVKQAQIDAARKLRIEADRYALDKNLFPDGSLLFTTAAEGYEAGYIAATNAAPSALPLQLVGGAGEPAPFYWSDCTPEEYDAILKAFDPLKQAHKWPIEMVFKAILTRIKQSSALPAAIPVGGEAPQWVPCSERLPDSTIFRASHMVLALLWNKNHLVAYYDYAAGFWREHTEGNKLDITHWMELPTAPSL
jgi:hypothetical protein